MNMVAVKVIAPTTIHNSRQATVLSASGGRCQPPRRRSRSYPRFLSAAIRGAQDEDRTCQRLSKDVGLALCVFHEDYAV
jgi:hypothetical protein